MTEKRLILFTYNYPTGFGEHFLETSVLYYSKVFDEVIIIPRFNRGNPRQVPENVRVSYKYSEKWPDNTVRAMLGGLFKPNLQIFTDEIRHKRNRFIYPLAWYRLLSFYHRSDYAYECFRTELSRYMEDGKTNLFYTYWLGVETMALGRLKHTFDFKLVSRVHNGDIYEERYRTPYLPYQKYLLESVDDVFCISEDGRQYFTDRYPEYSKKLTVSRLGTEPQNFTASQTESGHLHIVSCSNLVPVKRVNLIVDAITLLAESHPELTIRWTHIGDGILMDKIKKQATKQLTGMVDFTFKGNIPNHKVFSFYKNNPVDVFINLSLKEGIPVSIMEALSVGIPVVATNVGGTGEIVNERTGSILTENPDIRSVSKILSSYADKKKNQTLRHSCINEWKMNYNGPVNYRRFANELINVLKTSQNRHHVNY